MNAISGSRLLIYYNNSSNAISLGGISDLPYSVVNVGFLVASGTTTAVDDLKLRSAGGGFRSSLKEDIQRLHAAGKTVMVSLFGGLGTSDAQFAAYSRNVDALVEDVVGWVTRYGFDGVDIDYEETRALIGESSYSGVNFMIELTARLAEALPPEQNLISHAPQSPYLDTTWFNQPYLQIMHEVGDRIDWLNNQFYNNRVWDATAQLKRDWYRIIAERVPPEKLCMGVLLGDVGEGYTPPTELIADVIAPLKREFGEHFGGVMGWQFSLDEGGEWGRAVAHALSAS